MSSTITNDQRRFICGNCYNEFSTLSDLTQHANFCFVDQNDTASTSSSINSPTTNFTTTTIPFGDSFSSRLTIESSDVPFFVDQSSAIEISTIDRPNVVRRIRGRNISLAGIRVTPGLTTMLPMDQSISNAIDSNRSFDDDQNYTVENTTVDPDGEEIDESQSIATNQTEIADRRLPNGRIKKSYKIDCPICDRRMWRQNLRQHLRTHNDHHQFAKPHACPSCPRRFASANDLKRHSTIHELPANRQYFQCPFCSWSGLGNLNRHVRRKHPGRSYDSANVATVRGVVARRSTSTEEVDDEEQLAAVDGIATPNDVEESRGIEEIVEDVAQAIINCTYQPPDDEDLFADLIEIVERQLRDDPEYVGRTWREARIECAICWRVVNRTSYFEHRRIHDARSKSFECSTCGKTFRFKKRLVQHERIEHGGCDDDKTTDEESTISTGRFTTAKKSISINNRPKDRLLPWRKRKSICYVCGLMIARPKMAPHLKSHREEADGSPQMFECDQCSKSFGSSYFLRLHRKKTHEGYLPYKCQRCDFRASRRDQVIDHTLETHGELVDDGTILMDGISTMNHLATRHCRECRVDVFVENWDTHRIKHTRPDDYERMRREKDEQFRTMVRAQRSRRGAVGFGGRRRKRASDRIGDTIGSTTDGNGSIDDPQQNDSIGDQQIADQSIGRSMDVGDHDYTSSTLRRSKRIRVGRSNCTANHGRLIERMEESSDHVNDGAIEESSMDPMEPTGLSIDRSKDFTGLSIDRTESNSTAIIPRIEPIDRPIRYQCLQCNVGFENVQRLIQHDTLIH